MERVHESDSAAPDRRRGFVLIIVLVIVAMVAFAGFAFVNTMSGEYRAVSTNGDQLEAEQTLASAELLVLNILEHRGAPQAEGRQRAAEDVSETDLLRDNPLLFQEQLLLPPADGPGAANDPRAWRFSVVSPDRTVGADPGAASRFRFGLENESARLHLATLMDLDAIDPEQSRRVLMGFPGMTETIADSLLDWLDEDSEPRQYGAEAEDYRDRPNPLQPRNGLPVTLEELLLVRDVTPFLLFGPDENLNFVVDPWETPALDRNETQGAQAGDADTQGLGWKDLVTLSSAERNVDSRGNPRVDLNQPSDARLRQELSVDFPAAVVDFILLYRQYGPAAGRPATQEAGGASATTGGPHRFLLSSVGDLIEANVTASEGSSARTTVSPVTSTSRELLMALFDRTTTESQPVIPGRININLAPRPVLRALPGLEDDVVERVLGRRETLEDEQRRSPAWLLSEQILTLEQFRSVLPYITTGGDVYRAQLIAWRPVGGMYRRAEVVVDATRQPARRAAWYDLSAYGAAIPIEQLSLLADRGPSP